MTAKQVFKNVVSLVMPNAFPVQQMDKGIGYLPETPKNLNTFIAPVQLSRYRQDARSWRESVERAENAWYPHRVDMQRLFMDTILNGHVKACMKVRRDLTMLREFRLVDKNKKENEAVTAIFKNKWFEDFLVHTLNAIFFGYSLISIDDIVNGVPKSCGIIKRYNISPDRNNVTRFVYSIEGIPFLEEPFSDWHVWIPTTSELGISKCGYGLLYEVGLYEIVCRNVLGFNNDWVEVYGQPIRWAKTNKSQNDPERMMLEKSMRELGSSAYIITDPTDEIEFIETTNTAGANNPYENLEKRCEQKISKLILGHADGLDSTPGKLGPGGGEQSPAQIALNQIQIADARFVQNVVNSELIPKLQNLGVPIPMGLTFEFSNDGEEVEARQNEDKNNAVTAGIILTLTQAGFDVDEKYISDRTGIPVTKKEVVAPPAEQNFNDVKNQIRELYNK